MSLHRNKVIVLLLAASLMILTVGCGTKSTSSSLSKQPEPEILTEAVSTEEATTITVQNVTAESTTAQTTELPTQEPTEDLHSEREIVEAICVELGEGQFLEEPYTVREENDEFHVYENYADYLMHRAETFPERCLGSISDEEDMIEKARAVWSERLGAEYIDYVESEYVEDDGVKNKFERRYPPYDVKYYEEYDVWYIVTNPPSGIREDGVGFDVIWDCPPYLITRGEDGMILGAFI